MTLDEASFILANIDRRVCDDELNEALDMAIKALDQETEIKVLERDEVIRKLGTVDIYQASAWAELIHDLELLGLRICEVKKND